MKFILDKRADIEDFKMFYCSHCDIWFLSNEYLKYFESDKTIWETSCPQCNYPYVQRYERPDKNDIF